MLSIPILIFAVVWKVSAEVTTFNSSTESIVDNPAVLTYLDENGYIRLNITWDDGLCGAEYVSISFSGNEECNPISDVENYALDDYFLIRPSTDLEHPADHIIHGCTYNITFEDKMGPCRSQSLIYRVPECVENKCQCRNFSDSPNKLSDITSISEHTFLLAWNKSTEENVTIQYIYYQRKGVNDSTKTYIPEKGLQYRNNSVEIPMHDIKEDVIYTITVIFIDEFNECMYISTLDYSQPSSGSRVLIFATSVVAFIIVMLILYKISLWSPRVRSKLEKYVFFSKSYEPYESQELATPLSQFKLREEINAQYTPLEFVLKAHKYDEYEFPRNKIVMGKILGEGAFGKVLNAKAYEIGGKSGFTKVAVKQLKDGASEEEILDFQVEIDMLKRIGNHENIVKLLGCVTMDQPYLMIMKLVVSGNLKNYLLKLRKKWSEKKNNRIFFPDDMDEDWLKPNGQKLPDGRINYTSCMFDSSESSYIIPTTPKSADSSIFFKSSPEDLNRSKEGPHTPSSMNSSRIPSSTETELTNLDLETPAPPTEEINRLPEPVLDHTELQQFAFQVANGMFRLEQLSITHRDLAARNILVTSNRVLKISDFGMSRKGSYVNQKIKKVPLRWMAIESIQHQKWDSKSDVWSFGVVLWEIGTLGAFPYEHTHDIFILPELKKGTRLERPKICTDELYALMLRCWSENPEERPRFSDLVEVLDVKKRKVYVDFDQISPKYVFPPVGNADEESDGFKSENKMI